jgi:predicted outer membrane repeat protein
MNTKPRFTIYLVLILLAGVGLALALPVLAGTQAATRGDPRVPSAADGILYVAKSGDGSDGLSWTTAYTDLQAALAEAVSGNQIWVARGVYIPGVYVTDTFTLTAGVQLYGGFDPAGGVDEFDERDWGAYPTVLSGDIGGDDTNTDGVVLTTTHIVGDNSYHVVTADGSSEPITSTTLLDGFTITAGQANVYPDNQGGGYYCDGSGSGAECNPSLRHVTFSGNHAAYGGAMYNDGEEGTSSPTLTNVTFTGNSADLSGGAMYNVGDDYGTSSPSLRNVTFSGNYAGYGGGAMYNDGSYFSISSPSLANVTFTGNSADNDGGAMYNVGEEGISSPTLTNVTFSGNSAGEDGGAMYNGGFRGGSSPSLANVTFSGNSADRGGAMYNVTDQNFGTSSPSLANVTFSGNSADYGGAMYNDFSYFTISRPNLSNVILWGNTAVISGSQLYNSYASVAITTSLVQGGFDGSGVYNQDSTVIDGGGNLDADPDFMRHPDPGPNGDWDGVDDDYGDLHLGSGSPAIDSGTNSAISLPTDLDGNLRVVDGDRDGTAIVDIGAYEYNCPAGEILYVNHSASGAGGSWLEAKADLALGLKLLSYCPQVSQVWVATGVYTPGVHRSDSFDLAPGVAVYGGFDPAGGADQFSERDWGAYPTVLSGDIARDDVIDAHGVVTTTDHIVGGNSYHVVTADGTSTPITGTTVLDGFTITAGQANGYLHRSGGGYYCDGYGSGGECSPRLRNVTFSGNSAKWRGGAMYNLGSWGTSSPSLDNVTFSGNSADYGGAMYNLGALNGTSSPSLSDVTFSGNSADNGGAMYNCGSYDGTSSPTLTNVTFSGNAADYNGGAMFNYGDVNGISSPSLSNVTFSGNSAGDGGAMYNYGSYDGTSSPTLTNVTFSGNSAEDGGAMFNRGNNNGTSSPGLSNVILWGNTAVISGSQLYNGSASITVTTSLVQGGFNGSGVYNQDSAVIDGGGNLAADPDFVRHPDPGPDGDWDGVDDDYGDLHLRSGSPAVDSGTNSAISLPTDLDGDPRIVDGDGDGTATVDMGAYELQTYDAGFLYLPIIFR